MNKFLDYDGLAYFWGKIKSWANGVFAPIAHTHPGFKTKHSYTVAQNAAKNWYRIANANTGQTDTTKPIHAQFILTAYNASYDAGYYERWFVNAEVFGRTAHIVILGNASAPLSQARILYENTIADLDANDRPAIDIYLNYVLPNGTTKIEIEEVYNNGGWTFVADGQLAASTVPTGFESVAGSVRNNGVERSTYADYVSYLNRQISSFTAAFTLADTYLYRSRTLNCTGTFTITIPSINSGYMWCVIKNKNTSSGVITLHPSTTSVLIDGSNADITLQPMEYVCIHSAGANSYSLIADGRWKTQKAEASHVHGSITNDGKLGTASRVVVTDGEKAIAVSGVTSTELGYLSGVTSAVQTQLDAKAVDSDVVHTAGTETILGAKTFSSSPTIDAHLLMQNATIRRTVQDNVLYLVGGTSTSSDSYLALTGSIRSTNPGCFLLYGKKGSSSKLLKGGYDGTLQWDGQAIQTSSDERLKTPLASVPDAVLDAWETVNWGQFQFLDAVKQKGKAARLHVGVIAQRIKSAFEAWGLDACDYGILCHEKRPASEEEPAIDLWMVRYEEALAMEAVCQRRRADRLEARIKTLEEAMR